MLKKIKEKTVYGTCINPYRKASEKICTVERFKSNLENVFKEQLNVVSISLPAIPKSAFIAQKKNIEGNLDLQVFTYKKDIGDLLEKEFINAINYAISEFNADIICINELGLPLNKVGNPRDNCLQHAKKMAHQNKCLIVAGSYHCKSTFLNKGRCFFPRIGRSSGEKQFYKNISACGVDERLFTPANRIIFRTKAFNIGLAFIICLELVDYSSSAQLANMNELVDLLVVPTYLPDYGVMRKVAENLSSTLGGVLLTNHHDTTRHNPPTSRFYVGGKEFEKDHQITIHTDMGTEITNRILDLSDFKRRKDESIANLSNPTRCLYGLGKVIR